MPCPGDVDRVATRVEKPHGKRPTLRVPHPRQADRCTKGGAQGRTAHLAHGEYLAQQQLTAPEHGRRVLHDERRQLAARPDGLLPLQRPPTDEGPITGQVAGEQQPRLQWGASGPSSAPKAR